MGALVLRHDCFRQRFTYTVSGRAAILENSNGDISTADDPIYSMFGSRMGFSESADRMALFLVGTHLIGMWEKTMHEE